MIPNPYTLVAAGIVAVGLAVGGFTFGVKYQRGQDALAAELVAKAREEARLGAAEEIAKIEVKNTTIRQQLETVTREVEVYRDCRNTDDAMRLLNDALAGSSGGGELPTAQPTNR